MPMEPVGTLVLPPNTSVTPCPAMGADPSAGTSAAGWFCPRFWQQERGAQAKWPHRGHPQISPLPLPLSLPALGGEQGGAAGTPRASTLHARRWAPTLQLHAGIGVIACAHGRHNGIARPWQRGVLDRHRQQHSTLVGQLKAGL